MKLTPKMLMLYFAMEVAALTVALLIAQAIWKAIY